MSLFGRRIPEYLNENLNETNQTLLPLKEKWKILSAYDFLSKNEEAQLLNCLTNNNGGSLLISGASGINKTKAIISAIEKLPAKLQMKEVLTLSVNASSFEVARREMKSDKKEDVDLSEFRRIVLQNLVRNLFNQLVKRKTKEIEEKLKESEGRSNRLQNLVRNLFNQLVKRKTKEIEEKLKDSEGTIAELYKNAMATNVTTIRESEDSRQRRMRVEYELKLSLEVTRKIVGIAVAFISSLIIAFNPIPQLETVSRIVAVLVGIIPSALIAITWGFKRTSEIEREEKENLKIYQSLGSTIIM